ncbi:MAG: helix-turn-helix transcriptional regulator [Chloroflexi bacterium]|nr:helix-turn-helix transcriptional regulator [Chloroflexota bacterium]
MDRTSFRDMNCSVAQALEVLGDWWTLLIVRDAFFGARRFADFEASLGIAKNTLSDRLKHLVDKGVMEKIDAGQTGPRFEYRLTEKGRDLHIVLTALRQWSDKWVYGPGNEPLLVKDKRTGDPVSELRVTDSDGNPLSLRDMFSVAGPGANEETLRMFAPAAKKHRR